MTVKTMICSRCGKEDKNSSRVYFSYYVCSYCWWRLDIMERIAYRRFYFLASRFPPGSDVYQEARDLKQWEFIYDTLVGVESEGK